MTTTWPIEGGQMSQWDDGTGAIYTRTVWRAANMSMVEWDSEWGRWEGDVLTIRRSGQRFDRQGRRA